MIQYVVGFLFTEDLERVVLIHKQRPEFQVGKLNGIGGKIGQEAPLEAMIREFQEEAGIHIDSWYPFANLSGEGFKVRFFRAVTDNIELVRTVTDEKIEIFSVKELYKFNVLANVRWLIHMAISFNYGENCTAFLINEIYAR